jgi:hypothetical protein
MTDSSVFDKILTNALNNGDLVGALADDFAKQVLSLGMFADGFSVTIREGPDGWAPI